MVNPLLEQESPNAEQMHAGGGTEKLTLRVARTRVLLRKIRGFTATVIYLRVLSLTGLVFM